MLTKTVTFINSRTVTKSSPLDLETSRKRFDTLIEYRFFGILLYKKIFYYPPIEHHDFIARF